MRTQLARLPSRDTREPQLELSKRALSLQPDTILPVQYLPRPSLPAAPERQLMIAVVEEAILCLRRNSPRRTVRQRRLFREAEEWIMSDDRGNLFSFARICEIVSLDPDYIRRGVQQWQQPPAQIGADAERQVGAGGR
jgi:hypothetical protein